MNKPLKFFAATLMTGAAMLAVTTPAMAEVTIGVNLGLPQVYVQPAPIYYAPQPVYVQPQPVYVQPQPMYSQGRAHHRRGGPHRDGDHDGVPDRADRDRDGDGVPNRLDRAPDNPRRY